MQAVFPGARPGCSTHMNSWSTRSMYRVEWCDAYLQARCSHCIHGAQISTSESLSQPRSCAWIYCHRNGVSCISFVSISCIDETDLVRNVIPCFLFPHSKQCLHIAVVVCFWCRLLLYSNWSANKLDVGINTRVLRYIVYIVYGCIVYGYIALTKFICVTLNRLTHRIEYLTRQR
jgi:hypothetical protein